MSSKRRKPKAKFKEPQELEGFLSSITTTTTSREATQDIQDEEEKELSGKQFEEIRALTLKNDHLQAEVDKIKDDNKGRRTFSENIFAAVIIWMFLVLMTVFCSGLQHIHLSDNVLITLLTTATANVIALLVIVANYLFNKEKST